MTVRKLWPVLVLAALAACGSGEPDLAACEAAMRTQLTEAIAASTDGQTPEEGTRPSECEGVPDDDLEDMATDIMGEVFTDLLETPTP